MTIIIIIIIIIMFIIIQFRKCLLMHWLKSTTAKYRASTNTKIHKITKQNTYGIASPPPAAAAATATSTTATMTMKMTKNQVLAQQPLSANQITLLLMHVLTQQPQFKKENINSITTRKT
jgi:hypothetical protein